MTTREFSFSVYTSLAFEESLARLRQKLQREDFRVVADVQFDREFEKAIGLPWRRYTVLVVWNCFHAYQALMSDRDGGLFVPFNVVVAEDSGATLIAAKNNDLDGGLANSPLGIQVLARELNRKLGKIFLELARQEVIPAQTAPKFSPKEAL